MSIKFEPIETGFLPMKRGRVIKSLADSTIRGVIDAIVELVTNADDSYRRGEQEGLNLSGRIDITVRRGKGGHCEEIIVSDEALGMSFETLKKAIEFSGETSGFREGKTVRGFFGRGLKESIIALGKGTINTLNSGILSQAEIYYDEKEKDAVYKLGVPITNLTAEELLDFGFIGSSGTIVKIIVTNRKKDYISGWKTFPDQLANHFALRDINSSPKRSVFLHFYDDGGFSSNEQIRYVTPPGELVFDKEIKIENDILHFRIFESQTQLDSPKRPWSKGGILIKTEGAILDSQLFGFETDPVGLYFFGEVICPGIARAIREGDESVVDFNRGGLDWRHEYNRKLEEKSREILSRLIEEKRKKITAEGKTKVAAPIEKVLEKLCQRLSNLAKKELEEPEPNPGEIDSFMLRPLFSNIQPGIPRSFSVYAPRYLVDEEGTKIVELSSSNSKVELLQMAITLGFHKKYPGIMYGNFKIVGKEEGDVSTISARLGTRVATTEVRVAAPSEGVKKKRLSRGGGMFTKIIPDLDNDPIQRFGYEEGGIIKIFVKFPGLGEYLKDNLEGIATVEGRILLAEVLIEAYSRILARKMAGRTFLEEIDPFVFELDRLRKKATIEIYEIVFSPGIEKLLGEGF